MCMCVCVCVCVWGGGGGGGGGGDTRSTLILLVLNATFLTVSFLHLSGLGMGLHASHSWQPYLAL